MERWFSCAGPYGLQCHVAGTLDGPFIILLEEDRADEASDDDLHNVAIVDFEWTVVLERAQLRPRYREGFDGTPLNLYWQPDLRERAEGGADGSAQGSAAVDRRGVVRDDADQSAKSGRCLRERCADHAPAFGDGRAPEGRRGNQAGKSEG